MEKVKVMIVDDQYIARQLFEMYIKSSEKYKLVMQVDSAALATKALKGNPVDLILMDILMSDGSNGLSAACEINQTRSEDYCCNIYAGNILAYKGKRDWNR